MMKKLIILLSVVALLLALAACGATKILHCDHCGKEISVKESSNMEEDWIIFCDNCNSGFFGDDTLLGG